MDLIPVKLEQTNTQKMLRNWYRPAEMIHILFTVLALCQSIWVEKGHWCIPYCCYMFGGNIYFACIYRSVHYSYVTSLFLYHICSIIYKQYNIKTQIINLCYEKYIFIRFNLPLCGRFNFYLDIHSVY